MPFQTPFATAGEHFVENTISSTIKLRDARCNRAFAATAVPFVSIVIVVAVIIVVSVLLVDC